MGLERDDIANGLTNAIDGAIDELYDNMRDLLKGQPYSVDCAECGKDLTFTTSLDSDNDMAVTVQRCGCEL